MDLVCSTSGSKSCMPRSPPSLCRLEMVVISGGKLHVCGFIHNDAISSELTLSDIILLVPYPMIWLTEHAICLMGRAGRNIVPEQYCSDLSRLKLVPS